MHYQARLQPFDRGNRVVTRGVETIDGKWSYQTLVVLQYLYCGKFEVRI